MGRPQNYELSASPERQGPGPGRRLAAAGLLGSTLLAHFLPIWARQSGWALRADLTPRVGLGSPPFPEQQICAGVLLEWAALGGLVVGLLWSWRWKARFVALCNLGSSVALMRGLFAWLVPMRLPAQLEGASADWLAEPSTLSAPAPWSFFAAIALLLTLRSRSENPWLRSSRWLALALLVCALLWWLAGLCTLGGALLVAVCSVSLWSFGPVAHSA